MVIEPHAPSEALFVEQTDLTLDPKHPGLHDQQYVARRKFFFDLARRYRLAQEQLPPIEYSEEEHAIWRQVSRRLSTVHAEHACAMYLEGKRILGIGSSHLPQLASLSSRLERISGLRIIPAEGLIDFRNFFGYLSQKLMPSTPFLRHGANPEYTPEPDVIHDIIGHVPMLANCDYVDLIQLIGEASQVANDDQLLAFNRLYWFTIEFGLIEEEGQLKAFGAGLLSSYGEIKHAFSEDVILKPFDIDQVIDTDYDPSRMQELHFVIESFEDLLAQTQRLISDFGLLS